MLGGSGSLWSSWSLVGGPEGGGGSRDVERGGRGLWWAGCGVGVVVGGCAGWLVVGGGGGGGGAQVTNNCIPEIDLIIVPCRVSIVGCVSVIMVTLHFFVRERNR